MLTPCPGCGALFPDIKGPVHAYIGANAGCWALFLWTGIPGETDTARLIAESRIPESPVPIPAQPAETMVDELFGDAYGVQHHGQDSPQAIQSVALHFLNMYGIFSGRTTRPRWPIERALRTRGVFHKLQPPLPGSALTIRHLYPGGGVAAPVTRGQYVKSVYATWMELHQSTVERWYEQYVVQ
jgi:hypothetical protein